MVTKFLQFRRHHLHEQSLTFWTFAVTLTLNAVISFFPQDTPVYDAVLSNQVWLQTDQQFRRYNKNSHILIIKALLWPWHWTQWTNFSVRHSGLQCCITIPGLATKCSVVQKISSEQTFTNILSLCCDLGLECSNAIFSTGHSGLWCCTIKPSLVANGPAV